MSLFELFDRLIVLYVHIIVSGDFQRKSAKKRPLLIENMGTNTGLNVSNEPAMGCRLSVNDIHNFFMYIAYIHRNRKKVALLLIYCACILRRLQMQHSELK